MLEIVFSDSEKLLLERSNLFNKDDILSLTFLLSMGKLDDFEHQIKRIIGDMEANVPSEISKLKNKIKDYENIRIWYASNVNEEYLSMMYVVYLCSDKNIEVVDGYQRTGISGYADDEIKDLVKKSKILTKEEIQEYILKWNKIYDENSEVRFLNNNEIISESYEFFDNAILNKLSSLGEMKEWSLVANCMVTHFLNFDMDVCYKSRIDYLKSIDKIVVTKTVTEKNILGEDWTINYIKVKDEK